MEFAPIEFSAQSVSDLSYHGWMLVGLGFVGLMITWSVTLVTVMRGLDTRFADQSEKRTQEFEKVNKKFDALPQQFQDTRHSMGGTLAQVKLELKESIQEAEGRLAGSLSELKSDVKDLRGRHEQVERRVTQLEMLRMAAMKENGVRS